MASFSRNCEIVELEKETGSSHNSGNTQKLRKAEGERKPPLLKKALNKSLEDDINKLFEAIDIRTSKSLDLTDRGWISRRNSSKKPMRPGYHSPEIGFSEPVSLKQAFRGHCISQAAEMAAMKRMSSLPGSPRLLLAGKSSVSSYRQGGFAAGESSSSSPRPIGREGRVETSLILEEGISSSTNRVPQDVQVPKVKPKTSRLVPSTIAESTITLQANPISEKSASHYTENMNQHSHDLMNNSSPRLVAEPATKSKKSTLKKNEIKPASVEIQELEPLPSQEKDLTSNFCLSSHKGDNNAEETDDCVSVSEVVASSENKNVGTSTKVPNKPSSRPRRAGSSQAVHIPSTTKTGKKSKSLRRTPCVVKPAVRTKNFVKKKPKEETKSPCNSGVICEEESASKVNTQLICQRCHCTLKKAENEPSLVTPPPNSANNNTELSAGQSKPGRSKPNFSTNVCEQGDLSQSSNSSIGDYSSSTTISGESNLSGSSCGSRPHMSKDLRWQAINAMKKRYGFLGLSHFDLLKKLGCGDIGTVYVAELRGTNCLFAIKVMDNEFLARRKKLPRAQTEKEILRMLDHPFLPTLYAQFTTDDLSCLVMEFCPGGDLHVLRQKQPSRYFVEQSARFYVAEVLLALEYLHMLGILYRDLKPENILVREDGHIMLTDFDLSLRCSVNPTLLKSSSSAMEPPRMSGPCAGSNCIDPFCSAPSCKVSCFRPRIHNTSRTKKPNGEHASLPQFVAEPTEARSNSFVGTHEYLAPEIIKGEGHGSAVDWWTLGIFLFELLYGKTPFKGSGNEETLANVVLENLRFPDSPIVSFQARDLIRGLLVKEPENRLGSQTGAAEIKRHPFFDGLNWALIRSAIPPHVPEFYDVGFPKMALQGKSEFLECGGTGRHVQFELF